MSFIIHDEKHLYLNQRQVAELAGKSPNTVSRRLKGKEKLLKDGKSYSYTRQIVNDCIRELVPEVRSAHKKYIQVLSYPRQNLLKDSFAYQISMLLQFYYGQILLIDTASWCLLTEEIIREKNRDYYDLKQEEFHANLEKQREIRSSMTLINDDPHARRMFEDDERKVIVSKLDKVLEQYRNLEKNLFKKEIDALTPHVDFAVWLGLDYCGEIGLSICERLNHFMDEMIKNRYDLMVFSVSDGFFPSNNSLNILVLDELSKKHPKKVEYDIQGNEAQLVIDLTHDGYFKEYCDSNVRYYPLVFDNYAQKHFDGEMRLHDNFFLSGQIKREVFANMSEIALKIIKELIVWV